MSSSELIAIHDEIWRQIFHRQKSTLMGDAADTDCANDPTISELLSAIQAEEEPKSSMDTFQK